MSNTIFLNSNGLLLLCTYMQNTKYILKRKGYKKSTLTTINSVFTTIDAASINPLTCLIYAVDTTRKLTVLSIGLKAF